MLKSTHQSAKIGSVAPPPLPPGWTEHIAPTGHSYYYSVETQRSTYTRPVLEPSVSQSSVPFDSIHASAPISTWEGTSPRVQQLPRTNSFHRDPEHSRGGYKNHRRRLKTRSDDRPKSKQVIPGCSPWLLIGTRLGRRFVHNPQTNESFWKFPPHVRRAVIELDGLERETQGQTHKSESGKASNATSAVPFTTVETKEVSLQEERHSASDDEYSEAEENSSGMEDGITSPHSPRRDDAADRGQGVIEFNEDDIAYQLAAMGQNYGSAADTSLSGDVGLEARDSEGIPFTEEDANAIFHDLLDDFHISPFSTWDAVVADGRVIEDDRYTVLPNTKRRKEVFADWSRARIQELKATRERTERLDPRIPYLSFLAAHASPALYWPEFRRKFRKASEMRNSHLSDKERERLYREHVGHLKLPESTRKDEFVALLQSIPPSELNRDSSLAHLPPQLLSDIRFISLQPQARDALIETHIARLGPAPVRQSSTTTEQTGNAERRAERERREMALAQRERKVAEEKLRQMREAEQSKCRLQAEERELGRAMQVGKGGLRAQLGLVDDEAPVGDSTHDC